MCNLVPVLYNIIFLKFCSCDILSSFLYMYNNYCNFDVSYDDYGFY